METKVDEIADCIYRLSTFVPDIGPTGFTFNQFLVDADEPLLFHTGPRGMFPLVSQAISTVRPVEQLRWITFGHVEADECGAMNLFLAAAPNAKVAHNALGCMVSINDMADRPPEPIGADEVYDLGGKRIRNIDTPHVPHAWEAHVLYEETTGTLLCGDLFTQPGANNPPLTESDILEPSEALRGSLDYFAHARNTRAMLERLAATEPLTLACMHGSAWRGDGAALLRALADRLDK